MVLTPPRETSVTRVVALYRLRPNHKVKWLETWQRLATVARTDPACRGFTLDVELDDPDLCRAVSTWSSGSAFDRFVRKVGLIWIERHLNYCQTAPRYARYVLHDREVVESVARQPVHAGV